MKKIFFKLFVLTLLFSIIFQNYVFALDIAIDNIYYPIKNIIIILIFSSFFIMIASIFSLLILKIIVRIDKTTNLAKEMTISKKITYFFFLIFVIYLYYDIITFIIKAKLLKILPAIIAFITPIVIFIISLLISKKHFGKYAKSISKILKIIALTFIIIFTIVVNIPGPISEFYNNQFLQFEDDDTYYDYVPSTLHVIDLVSLINEVKDNNKKIFNDKISIIYDGNKYETLDDLNQLLEIIYSNSNYTGYVKFSYNKNNFITLIDLYCLIDPETYELYSNSPVMYTAHGYYPTVGFPGSQVKNYILPLLIDHNKARSKIIYTSATQNQYEISNLNEYLSLQENIDVTKNYSYVKDLVVTDGMANVIFYINELN